MVPSLFAVTNCESTKVTPPSHETCLSTWTVHGRISSGMGLKMAVPVVGVDPLCRVPVPRRAAVAVVTPGVMFIKHRGSGGKGVILPLLKHGIVNGTVTQQP